MFETILEEINGFGPFQIINILLLWTPRLVIPCHFLLNNFIDVAPPHHCDISALDDGGLFRNLTEEQKLTVSIPAGEDGELKSCEMFAEPQFQLLTNSSSSVALPTVMCQSGWVYDNSTFRSTLVTEWDLVCNRKNTVKTINMIFIFGETAGSVLFGYLCDKFSHLENGEAIVGTSERFGRRRTLLASYILSLALSVSISFANSHILFAVLRFFIGFSLTGIICNVLVLSIEWTDVRHRSTTSMIDSLAWSVGNMLLAAVAFLVPDWRKLVMTITAPLIFATLTWWWLPESARWLLANGKVEEAQFYLDRCAKINKRQKLSRSKVETLSNIEILEQRKGKSYSYLNLIRTPKMRRLALHSGIMWFGVTLTYYGISLNISGFGLSIYLTHFIYAAIEFPSKLLVYFFIGAVGRRKCQAGSLLLTGLCVAINIFIPKDLWFVRLAVAILGKAFSEASFTTAFLYTTELYPTVIRQTGLGYTGVVRSVATAVVPLVLMLKDSWTVLPQVIILSVDIASGLVALLLPETLNVRLPETIEDIEKPQSENSVNATNAPRTPSGGSGNDSEEQPKFSFFSIT